LDENSDEEKKGLVHNNSHENEFNLHVNEISVSYERTGAEARFDEEAEEGNSEMAYLFAVFFSFLFQVSSQCTSLINIRDQMDTSSTDLRLRYTEQNQGLSRTGVD